MNEANTEQLISALPEVPAAEEAPAPRVDCDICGEPIAADDDSAGKGVFLSVRGDEVRYEDVPLCATCATAIGINALIRAEIEEDEG
jgi:hypothetical protein